LWRLEGIDVAQVHAYDPRPGPTLTRLRAATAELRRPVMIAEIGRGWDAPDDQRDRDGAYLRHALWITWMAGFSGSSLPWWWDTHIEPNHLHERLKPLAAFIAGEDPRGHPLRPTSVILPDGWESHWLISPDLAYGFLADASVLQRPGAAPAPQAPAASLAVAGLSPGAWSVEAWDAERGTVVDRHDATVVDGGPLAITLPAGARELAFKCRRRHPMAPAVRLEAK
jgi:hypothetical protein